MMTLRQQMIAVLQGRFMDQRELSQAVGIREKEVAFHLPHIARSAAAHKLGWQVQPAYCENKCPRCRTSRIRGPWYKIDARDGF